MRQRDKQAPQSAEETVRVRTVETSHLPVRHTLDKIAIPKTTFYAWLDRYAAGGFDALEDRKPRPKRVWNRISDEVRNKVIERALEKPELSPREVAVAFTDAEKTFVSEASVYRILKAEGLVTSPAFIVMKAAGAFANPTTAINQLWQTDFTYLKVTGWGWFYLSTVLDDPAATACALLRRSRSRFFRVASISMLRPSAAMTTP